MSDNPFCLFTSHSTFRVLLICRIFPIYVVELTKNNNKLVKIKRGLFSVSATPLTSFGKEILKKFN